MREGEKNNDQKSDSQFERFRSIGVMEPSRSSSALPSLAEAQVFNGGLGAVVMVTLPPSASVRVLYLFIFVSSNS